MSFVTGEVLSGSIESLTLSDSRHLASGCGAASHARVAVWFRPAEIGGRLGVPSVAPLSAITERFESGKQLVSTFDGGHSAPEREALMRH
jgi:hypothetical protein